MPDRAALAAPDLDTAAWPLPPPDERIAIGSEAHKVLFSRALLDTFDPYRPAVLDWPRLDAQAQARLTSLPIWDIAVQTETRAGARMQRYADSVADPLIRKALALNAFEERRHKMVLGCLVEAYGIALEPEPPAEVPRDPEWAYMHTGFAECIDSFFAFGLFETARRSGFFPPELVRTFEPVIQEEGRHILFFINWVAWHRRQLGPLRRIAFELKVCAVWASIAWERIGLASGLKAKGPSESPKKPMDSNFTATSAASLGYDIDAREFMELCLAENDRRLGIHDSRLVRPVLVPRLVRALTAVLGLFALVPVHRRAGP
ncbi:MAG TPA: hypothetical protein VFV70_05865 [Hyphomonadaceae bacterium]|nr:hypothetical protein [Hyphomonadaceae bacterium]